MAERIGTAVLELTTGGGLLQEFNDIKGGARGVDSEFEKLRRRTQDVGGELKRMTERFQGRSLVEEAQRVAAAVKAVGGAAKLTDSELKSVSATVAAATQKLHRMGEEVPPGIRKLNTEIAALDRTTDKAAKGGIGSLTGGLGGLRTLLPALSVVGAVGMITRLGTAALQSADEIVKFSEKTGVSIETTQRWRYAAEQTGTSLDAFANAAFKLGINVGTGTDKVREAVKGLNLSYADLKAMKPEDQFRVITTALEGVESVTERNRLGTILFGKTWGEIAPAVSEGLAEIADSANVASDAAVKAAEAAGDAWGRFTNALQTGTITALGGVVMAIEDIERAADSMTAWQKFMLFVKGGAGGQYVLDLKAMGAEMRTAAEEQEAINKAFAALPPNVGAASTATRDYVGELGALNAEVKRLRTEYGAQLTAALKVDGVTEDLATQFHTTEKALRMYESSIKATTKTLSEHEKEVAKLQAIVAKFRTEGYLDRLFGTSVRAQIAETNKELHAHVDNLDRMETTYIGIVPAVASWQAALVPLKAAVTEVNGELVQQVHDVEQFRVKWAGIGAQMSTILIQSFTGGGGVQGAFKALGALGGQEIGKSLGASLAKHLGGKLGGIIGGMAGPLGAALGALAGNLAGKFFGKLFGGGEHKKVNDLRDAFTSAAGGIHELNVRAQAAGLTLDRFLKAKTVKEYEAAVAELEAAFERLDKAREENLESANDLFSQIIDAGRNGIPDALRSSIEKFIELGLLTEDQIEQLRALGEQTGPTLDQLEGSAAALGAKLEDLGPKFRQAKLDEEALRVNNAINQLVRNGGDVGSTLMAAREELGALVSNAKAGGLTLSSSLRPWIEDLLASGNLIDENGERITDLAGISWGPEQKDEAKIAEEGWNKILAAIERLITMITGPLDTALDDVTKDRTIHVRVEYDKGDEPLDPRFRDGERTSGAGYGGGAGNALSRFGLGSAVPARSELSYAGRLMDGGSSISNTTNNQAAVVGLIMGQSQSPREIGRQAAGYLARTGFPANVAGVASGVEQLVEQYLMTYGAARGTR